MSTSPSSSDCCMTFRVHGHLCGLPIACVREVLDTVEISRVPLAPTSVAGHLNLRGRIVTAIDPSALFARSRHASCRMPSNDNPSLVAGQAAIVLEHVANLYALLIDQTGDVVPITGDDMIGLPADQPDGRWAALAHGVLVRADDLIVVLDPARLIAALSDCPP